MHIFAHSRNVLMGKSVVGDEYLIVNTKSSIVLLQHLLKRLAVIYEGTVIFKQSWPITLVLELDHSFSEVQKYSDVNYCHSFFLNNKSFLLINPLCKSHSYRYAMVGNILWCKRSGVIHPCICKESAHQKHWDKQKAHITLPKENFLHLNSACCAIRTHWLLTPVKAEAPLWWRFCLFPSRYLLFLSDSDFSSSIHLTSGFVQGVYMLSTHSHLFSGPEAGESEIKLSGDVFSLANTLYLHTLPQGNSFLKEL